MFRKCIMRCAMVSAFLSVSAGLLVAGPVSAMSNPPRALWVWDTRPIYSNPSEQDRFFAFLAAPHGEARNHISTIFFDAFRLEGFKDPKAVKEVRQFLKAAHRRHMRVDFLTGDSEWVKPAGQDVALGYVNAVLAFNRAGKRDERFDGFQFDVEPYLLPGWPDPQLIQGLMDMLDKSKAAIRNSGQKLIFTLAIPRFYGDPAQGYLDRKVIDRTDEVVVMDYVTDAKPLVNDVQDVLSYAGKTGKKVWIGVETGELKDTPQSTFFGGGNSALEAVLAQAAPAFKRERAFAGYGIHHWNSYLDLKP